MKNQLTENQELALTILNSEVIEGGDLFAEGASGEWVVVSQLLAALTNNGWSQKQAEGTIGSLTGSYLIQDEKDAFGNHNVHTVTKEEIYWLEYFQQEAVV